ncbi:pentapeptide repeat-containing protein [Niabella pedocola]|uniref:Pentapeptide repeat-containing protein n=1 Tax=Niabella pedocola TaxID=1752077 RepID=A0ABS8PWS2_9BACT|nr:pentapeptide repeat-containing protein [Niabella pedocola]MCD2425523.1 pentapeptide repeat-containing protein [Niabella pedocola]
MDTKIMGGKIATARKKINISQAQLAEQLFISPQAVGKWERGESVPDIITMNRLAVILGVDLNYFSESFSSAAFTPGVYESPSEAPIDAAPTVRFDESQVLQGTGPKRRSWDMSRASWVDADFSGLKDLHEKFSSSNMQRCKFMGSDLSGLLMKSNHIVHCDFSDAIISGSHIQSSHLASDQFKACMLKEAVFSGCHIQGCDFSDADFAGATFKFSSCQKNTLTNTRFHRTSFIGSDISDMVFNGEVKDCYFENCAFSRVTFQDATLINTFFKGRSLKKIRFVNCRADRMTYEFLKNGKADLKGITLLAS